MLVFPLPVLPRNEVINVGITSSRYPAWEKSAFLSFGRRRRRAVATLGSRQSARTLSLSLSEAVSQSTALSPPRALGPLAGRFFIESDRLRCELEAGLEEKSERMQSGSEIGEDQGGNRRENELLGKSVSSRS